MNVRGDHVHYAKNPRHDRFLCEFEGHIKGRYLLALLVGTGVLGGLPLRQEVERELGLTSCAPDQMYDAALYIRACDRASRAGLSMVRMGELIFPAYRRSHPALFEGKTVVDAFRLLEHAYRTETSWGGMSQPLRLQGNQATFYRKSQPGPCELGKGALLGVLRTFELSGAVDEVACQWEGAEACRLEVTWG
jgi:hypothetical protein